MSEFLDAINIMLDKGYGIQITKGGECLDTVLVKLRKQNCYEAYIPYMTNEKETVDRLTLMVNEVEILDKNA